MAYLSDIEIAQRCKPEHIGVTNDIFFHEKTLLTQKP